jgi:hypothetical protein
VYGERPASQAGVIEVPQCHRLALQGTCRTLSTLEVFDVRAGRRIERADL